jgi:hypothetical protein
VATVTVHIKGLDRLLKGLDAAPMLLDRESEAAMKDSVSVVQGQIEAQIPYGPGRFGHLRDLITTRVLAAPVRGLIDARKFTAPMVEGGTKPHLIKVGNLVIHHPGAKAQHPMKKGFDAAKAYVRVRFLRAGSDVLHEIATA